MITLNVNNADSYVTKLQNKGVAVRWDGWDMVFFTEDSRALRSKRGRRLGNAWGFETRIQPNEQGQWLINYHLTRGDNGKRG